jgi:hypothetical protein
MTPQEKDFWTLLICGIVNEDVQRREQEKAQSVFDSYWNKVLPVRGTLVDEVI